MLAVINDILSKGIDSFTSQFGAGGSSGGLVSDGDIQALVKTEQSKEEADILSDGTLLSSEILELVFEHLDIRRLQTARAVCRQWNEEASRVLKRTSPKVCKYAGELRTFVKILDTQGELSSPFRYLSLRSNEETRESISELERISQKGIALWEINVPADFFYQLGGPKLFPQFSTTLTRLTIERDYCYHNHGHDTYNFPALKYLSIALTYPEDSSCSQCASFLVSIINGSPNLQTLTYSLTKDINASIGALKRIFQETTSTTIKRLKVMDAKFLIDPSTSLRLLKALKCIKFEVTHLELQFLLAYWKQNQDLTMELLEILTQHSSTLRHLNLKQVDGIDYEAFCNEFPHCPNLRNLIISEYYLGSRILENTPALNRLEVTHVTYVGATISESQVTSLSVERVGFHGIRVVNPLDSNWNKEALVELLKQFPNALTWDMSLGNIMDICELLRSGRISHSKFQKLRIWTCIGSNERHLEFLTNMSSYERNGTPSTTSSSKYNGPSLLDLKDLKELELDYEEVLDQSVIRQCVGQLKNLEVVKFHWFNYTWEKDIKALGHLKKIVISSCCPSRSIYKFSQLNHVFSVVPNVVCECRSSTEF